MRSYTIKTHADQEFSHGYSYVSVIDTHYEGPNDEILVLDTEVEEGYENRYQRELDSDQAVISYVCDDVFGTEVEDAE